MITEAIGVSTALVKTLRAFNQDLPIDFLAKILKIGSQEVREEVAQLAKRGVVRQEGEQVRLIL